MDRILYSPNSEDWVTWNFFQIMFRQYPTEWWGHLVSAAGRRNRELNFSSMDRSLPKPTLWSCVSSPSNYEAQSRIRMRESENPNWVLRASNPKPVEGVSEIDVSFDHDEFLVYVEAKLGSDISMSTSYDPHRNQIVRNIDCLLERAGSRTPLFWMLVRDEKPSRAYMQLISRYKSEPELLADNLPHRDPEKLKGIAQKLTLLLWSDFKQLVCGLDSDEESMAVNREFERRIAGNDSAV